MEQKKKKDRFLVMFTTTLGASLVSVIIVGKEVIRADEGVVAVSRGTIRAGKGFKNLQ